jgi:hypothetical protein
MFHDRQFIPGPPAKYPGLQKGSAHSLVRFPLTSQLRVMSFQMMPRRLRVQYPGAIYHIMSRGDREEDIFLDDVDRQDFLKTLAEACQKRAFEPGWGRAVEVPRPFEGLSLDQPGVVWGGAGTPAHLAAGGSVAGRTRDWRGHGRGTRGV